MRILSIDFGKAKVGLAINEDWLAEPLAVLRYSSFEKLLAQIARICQEHQIEKMVVGVSEGQMAEEQKKFAQKLTKLINLPVDLQDETLTTQEAMIKMEEIGKKIKEEDAIAAALILQGYLEKQKPKNV